MCQTTSYYLLQTDNFKYSVSCNKKELKSGVFKPAKPFSSLKSVGYNAAVFGSIMGVQRLSCKGLELARRREDYYNNIFGCAVAYKYYTFFLGSSERRLIMHNRTIGTGVIITMFYGHFLE